MNRRSRQVLAVLAVTTALCADGVAAASPALRPQATTLAGRIVNRLTLSFGRTVGTVAEAAQVRPGTRALSGAADVPTIAGRPVVQAPARQALSPFQFRLPPPAL